MKLTDYLKDRLTAYFIYGISLVLMLIFMAAFRISFQAIVIVSLILWLAVIVSELWGYFRKKSYYDKLLHCLDELDKKYLLFEMTENPDFWTDAFCTRLCRKRINPCVSILQNTAVRTRDFGSISSCGCMRSSCLLRVYSLCAIMTATTNMPSSSNALMIISRMFSITPEAEMPKRTISSNLFH